jgi:hypothetical protein
VAVKMFDGVRLDEAEEHTLRELRKEAEMLEKLSNHPCIVKFVGAITQGIHPPGQVRKRHVNVFLLSLRRLCMCCFFCPQPREELPRLLWSLSTAVAARSMTFWYADPEQSAPLTTSTY